MRQALLRLSSRGGSGRQINVRIWRHALLHSHIGRSPFPAMTYQTNPSLPNRTECQDQSNPYAAPLLRAVSIAAGATLLIFVLFLSLGRFRLSETGQELLIAFTYSTLIALPSTFLLTRISHRYTGRFPRPAPAGQLV